MATPIKERGIKWQESYGDKSAPLKKSMEEQIGIGSYFRWEGYDHTTDTEYYVVVSPGYSEKKGYFFFAGLRKIPAEHGASGKKFNTLAEALNYSMNTWNVPRPKQRPAKPYNIGDIRNKPIVLEAQPSGKHASIFIGKVISSEMQKEAMSMAVSGGTMSNFVQRSGEKTLPEMLCWSYKASGIMGILAALNTRKRFVGTDVLNVGKKTFVQNDFTGDYEKSPLAPKRATCDSPTEEIFQTRTENGREDNPLVDIKRKGGKIVSYTPQAPMAEQDSEGYSLYRWKNVRLTPKLRIPTNLFYSPAAKQVWAQLADLGLKYQRPAQEFKNLPGKHADDEIISGVVLPSEAHTPPDPKSRKQNIAVSFSVDPRAYSEFKQRIASLYPPNKAPHIKLGNEVQKNLVDLLDYHRESNADFNWETPCFEQMRVNGTQFIQYDANGILPISMRMGSSEDNMKVTEDNEEIPDEKLSEIKKERDDRAASYEFKSIPNIVARNSSALAIALGKKQIEADSGNVQAQQEVSAVMMALVEARKNNDFESFKQIAKKYTADPEVQKWVTNIQGRQATQPKIEQAITQLYQLKGEVKRKNNKGEDSSQERLAYGNLLAELRPIFSGFQLMGGYNFLKILPTDVADSSTCDCERDNVLSKSYATDNSNLPLDEKNRLADGQNGRGLGYRHSRIPFAPKASARAKMEKTKDGRTVAASRYFNPNEIWQDAEGKTHYGREHYGENPENVQAVQDVTGLPVVVEDPIMVIPDGKGGLRKLRKGILHKKDANSHGRYIPSGVYDVTIGPPEESAMKTGRKLFKGGIHNNSFTAFYSEQTARESEDGLTYSYRPLHPKPLFKTDPSGKNRFGQPTEHVKNFYTIKDANGQLVDLSSQFEKGDDGHIHAKNTAALMALLSRQLGLSPEDIGPFTPLSSSDIQFIYEKAEDSIDYYRAVQAYREGQKSSNLFEQGRQFEEAGVDEQKLNYGRVCDACMHGGDRINPDIVKDMQNALQNPEESLKPKSISAYGVKFKTKGSPEPWDVLRDDDNKTYIFGSHKAATTKIQELNQPDKDFEIFSEMMENGVMTFGSVGKPIVKGADKFVNKINSYKQGMTRDQVEIKQGPDKYAGEYAPEFSDAEQGKEESAEELIEQMEQSGTKPEEIKQKMDEAINRTDNPADQAVFQEVKEKIDEQLEPQKTPGLSDVPVAPTPEVPVPTQPVPAQPVPAPAQMAPVPQAPAQPATASQEAERIIARWRLSKKPVSMWDAASSAHQSKPEVYQALKQMISEHKSKQMTPVGASALRKLISLANRYDDEGKHDQAETIDKLIKIVVERI